MAVMRCRAAHASQPLSSSARFLFVTMFSERCHCCHHSLQTEFHTCKQSHHYTMSSGGIKGFFQRAGKSFKSGGIFARDSTWWLVHKGAQIGFIIATTSMVALVPLLFEIAREGQVRLFREILLMHATLLGESIVSVLPCSHWFSRAFDACRCLKQIESK